MAQSNKTKKQLMDELTELRKQVKHSKENYEAAAESAIVKAINRIFREALLSENEADFVKTCLKVCEQLTGADFGFMGEVNPAGRFDTIALSDPGWKNCRLPGSEATLLINNMEIRGLWGRVIKTQKSLIVNDPKNHKHAVGIPEGHPPLKAFLGVPLKRQDKTFGMIALGNKPGGFTKDDQRAVEALSVAIVEAFMSKRTEIRLARQSQEILELSTPVIQMWEGIIAAPLIGTMDSGRTQQFMNRFLESIVKYQSTVALIDITGVGTIDTQTAQHLIEAISAAALLGTRVILTGVSPTVAQTLVHLGIEISEFQTRASLAAGLRDALAFLKLKVVDDSE